MLNETEDTAGYELAALPHVIEGGTPLQSKDCCGNEPIARQKRKDAGRSQPARESNPRGEKQSRDTPRADDSGNDRQQAGQGDDRRQPNPKGITRRPTRRRRFTTPHSGPIPAGRIPDWESAPRLTGQAGKIIVAPASQRTAVEAIGRLSITTRLEAASRKKTMPSLSREGGSPEPIEMNGSLPAQG